MKQRTVSSERLIYFSDAVFAIAITILVLGITVPEISKVANLNGVLTGKLLELWPKIFSFIFSFSIIGIFWSGHHILFQYIKRANRILIWLNLLYLMFISFIPFPAALLGQFGAQESVVVLYGFTIFMIGLTFGGIWLYASQKQRLINNKLNQQEINRVTTIIFMPTVIYFAAILIAIKYPIVSLLIYIIIPILYILPSPIDEFLRD